MMDNNAYDSIDALAALIIDLWMASDVATLLLPSPFRWCLVAKRNAHMRVTLR